MKPTLILTCLLSLAMSGMVMTAEQTGEQMKQQKSQEEEKQPIKGQASEQGSVRKYMDDAMITTKVKAALAKDPGASALAISVETTKGVVQLTGSVDSAEEKMNAESIARGVEGVRGVENKLTVKGASSGAEQ